MITLDDMNRISKEINLFENWMTIEDFEDEYQCNGIYQLEKQIERDYEEGYF